MAEGKPPPTESRSFGCMDATATLRAAREAGLKLALNEEKDGIMAGPPERITPEIRRSIRANREEILRDLLFKLAFQQKLIALDSTRREVYYYVYRYIVK